MVTVDEPLPTWGETKFAYNKATRPLEVNKDAREKQSRVLVTLLEVEAKPRLALPYVLGPRPDASSRVSQTIRGQQPSGRDRWSGRQGLSSGVFLVKQCETQNAIIARSHGKINKRSKTHELEHGRRKPHDCAKRG
jgi:hypothetical protein